jgi:hypothetical protein
MMDFEAIFKLLVLFGGMAGICLGGIYVLRLMGRKPPEAGVLDERLAEAERRLADLEERADFAERMLTDLRDRSLLPPGGA